MRGCPHETPARRPVLFVMEKVVKKLSNNP